jgi:hypothetical protein
MRQNKLKNNSNGDNDKDTDSFSSDDETDYESLLKLHDLDYEHISEEARRPSTHDRMVIVVCSRPKGIY